MIVQVDEHMSLEVYFDPADREQGFDDEIRFRIYESGPKDVRLFEADETSFLLTIKQAEELAAALQKAAAEARNFPHSCIREFRLQTGDGVTRGQVRMPPLHGHAERLQPS
jgi:hypothetical protein